jgi:thiamine transporter
MQGRTRVMVEIALSVALAAVLNTFKVFVMPMGGSVSLSMLPIFVLALRRGLCPGMAAGAVYGIVDLMFGPVVVNWAQFLLDYPLAFGMVGAAGTLSPLWRSAVARGRTATAVWSVALPAIVLGSLARFSMHWLSGVVFFSQFAGDQAVWLYSLLYNGAYIGPSLVVCAAAALVLLPVLERVSPVR